MYRAFDQPAIAELLGIDPEADRPVGLILHGCYDMPSAALRWRDRLADARVARKAFNLVIGRHEGATLWYAPVIGAPMAALVVHCACALGARCVVQIGSFGGTRRNLQVGDLLLVTEAGRGEAASDWYLADGEPASADEALTERLRAALRARGLPWHEGTVFTTPAFMAETWDDIVRWGAEGYAGVEMEAATTFAVAKHFGVPAAALIYLLDNLIAERHLLDNTLPERERVQQARDLVQEIALEAIVGAK
jgi:uridine phosphorylase